MDPVTFGIMGLAGLAGYELLKRPKVTEPKQPPPKQSQTDLGGGAVGLTINGVVQPQNQEQQTDNQLINAGIKDAGQLAKGNYVGAVFDYVKIASGVSMQIRQDANAYLGKTNTTSNVIAPLALAGGGLLASMVAAPYAIPIAAFVFAIIDASQIIEEKQRNAQYDALKAKRDAFIDKRQYVEAMGVVKEAADQGFGTGWGFNVAFTQAQALLNIGTEASNITDLLGYTSSNAMVKLSTPDGQTYDPGDLLGQATSPLIDWYNNYRANNGGRRPTRAELNIAGEKVFQFYDWVGFHFPWTLTLKDTSGNNAKSGLPITQANHSWFIDASGNWDMTKLTTCLKDTFSFPVAEDVSTAQGGTVVAQTQQQQQANTQDAKDNVGGGKTQGTGARSGL